MDIELYLYLFLPAYRFTLLHQRNRSHIGDVVPSLHLLIKQYEHLQKKIPKANKFFEVLIKNIKKNSAMN